MTAAQTAAPKARKGKPTKQQPAPKVCLVASGKGGSSKSTFCTHMAVAASQAGLRVAVLDLDKQKTAAKWWERRPEQLPALDCYVSDLAGSIEALDAIGDADLVVIDTPPSLDDYPSQTKELIKRADFVLVPTGTGFPDTESASEFMAIVHDVGGRGAFCLSAVNRKSKSLIEAKRRLNEVGTICPIEVPNYEDVKNVFAAGVTTLDVDGTRGADDMAAVWTYLRKELGLK